MGRRLNISHSTVINTELAPLTESFWLEPNGQTEQWYYENTRTFAPDRQITPLIITPRISAVDTESGTSYTPLFANIAWTVLQWNGSAYAETTITNVIDTTEHDYVIIGNTLKVNKNNSEATHGITIKCNATYIDPRDSGVVYTVIDELLLTTNRDATLIYPKINILAESARGYNPLRDQSSLFSFKAAADWSDIPSVHSAPMEFNDDVDGVEEIVPRNLSSAQTCVPSIDIDYGSVLLENQRFMLRPTGGGSVSAIPNDVAYITSIKGKTVKFNQNVVNGDFSNGTNGWTISQVKSTVKHGRCVCLYTEGVYNHYLTQLVNTNTIVGHKIFVQSYEYGNSSPVNFRVYWNSGPTLIALQNGYNKDIVEMPSHQDANRAIYIRGVENYLNTKSIYFVLGDIVMIDLTEMFGAGNEPTTVAQFEQWCEENLGDSEYFDHADGSLLPVNLESLKTTGFNLYNPNSPVIRRIKNQQYQITGTYTDVWESWFSENAEFMTFEYGNEIEPLDFYYINNKRYVSLGLVKNYDTSTGYLKNATFCIYNNQVYKCTTQVNSGGEEFDSSKWTLVPDFAAMVTEGIFTMVSITPDANGIFTPTERYIHVEGGNATDTCVHLVHSGERNGEYEPYKENTKSLPITTMQGRLNGTGELVTIFPDGLKSVGSVYDEIKVENGVVKAIKRVGSIDLGTLDWTISTTPGIEYRMYFNGSIYNIKRFYALNVPPNILCAKYPTIAPIETEQSIGISYRTFYGCEVWVSQKSYTDPSAFQTAMSGVMLYYELETPLEYVVENLPRGTFEWYGVSGGNEVLIETLPCYVSGQHTDTLVVDAMYGENISVVLRIKNLGWDDTPMPPKESRNVAWRIPPLESFITCDEGNAVRSTSGDFNFGTIVNMNGETIDAERKAGHLRFHWNSRKCDLSTVVDRGWGQEVKIPASELRNNPTQANTIASSIVGNEVYMLGAYEEVTHNNETVTHNGQKVYERTTV